MKPARTEQVRIGPYDPELNPLYLLWHHAVDAHEPAGKSVPVPIVA